MRGVITRRLLQIADRRDPDFCIGDPADPYLRRWWVIPRNPLFNIYLHEIRKSDDDRALHDHPWINVSWLLRGMYCEVMPRFEFQPLRADFTLGASGKRAFLKARLRFAGEWVFRWPSQAHRLEIIGDLPCWTLFITGPLWRQWGFRCEKGWRHWRAFTAPNSKGQIGRGCD